MNLLFVEDEPEMVKPVIRLIERKLEDMNCKVVDFDIAVDTIQSQQPDIVVLDLLVGGASATPNIEGLKTRDFIWDYRFCPIIVYSAEPEIYNERYEKHPFVSCIKKGGSSAHELLEALVALRPHVAALKEAESHIGQQFALAMRTVAPYAFSTFEDPERRNETIIRSGRRRLAAFMDNLSKDGERLAGWEQYLYPPVSLDTQLGDILWLIDGKPNDPSSYRIVLTPSCDLVNSGRRSPKVRRVLVARCQTMKEGLDSTALCDMKPKKLQDRLEKDMLSKGHLGEVIPLPAIEGVLPIMAANLKDLELIPIEDIGVSDADCFIRVASIDSPFRELVSWAYLQVACRPGLPDRNFGAWRDEILTQLENDAKKKNEGL